LPPGANRTACFFCYSRSSNQGTNLNKASGLSSETIFGCINVDATWIGYNTNLPIPCIPSMKSPIRTSSYTLSLQPRAHIASSGPKSKTYAFSSLG
jgi:hypothetical protein